MKMKLTIYKNHQQVNEFSYTEDADIYKELALVLYEKVAGRPTKSKIKYDKAAQYLTINYLYDETKTGIKGTTYKYQYEIKNIYL